MSGRNQTGYIWKVGHSWYGRWYRDEFVDGVKVRRQHSEKLCEVSNRYRSEKDVRPLLAEKLKEVNEGHCPAESTLSVVKYADDYFFSAMETQLRPSTIHGYRGLWKMYLKPHLGDVSLRDFTCGKATHLLNEVHREHKLSRKSLRHVKGLLRSIFSHAKVNDVLFADNPIKDAAIPRRAVKANKTHAYGKDEMMQMLDALHGTARTAVGLMFFAGLRPGEARGAKWSDYDAANRILNVKRSIWRKYEGLPKTEESIAPIPVSESLRKILAEADNMSEYILATPSGRPIDLHNLAAREIRPQLQVCAICHIAPSEHDGADHDFKALPKWCGFYGLRRGIGTALADVDSAVAAKSVLRHSNVATTAAHYIKSDAIAAARAMDKIDMLFDNGNVSGRPN